MARTSQRWAWPTKDLVENLTGCGWLGTPGTVGDLLASRPKNATPIAVPSLVPHEDGMGPFTSGKKMRPELSGWAQKVISDNKPRKDALANWVPTGPGELQLVVQLTAADWLTEAALTDP